MPKITIKKFRRVDAPLASDMLQKLAAHHDDLAKSSADDFLKTCLGSKKIMSCWIVWQQQQAIGFAISYDWMNFVRGMKVRHLDLIFIDQEFRSKGLGKKLIGHVAKDAIKNGCGRLDVGASQSNVDANKFYSSLGFLGKASGPIKYKIQGAALVALGRI